LKEPPTVQTIPTIKELESPTIKELESPTSKELESPTSKELESTTIKELESPTSKELESLKMLERSRPPSPSRDGASTSGTDQDAPDTYRTVLNSKLKELQDSIARTFDRTADSTKLGSPSAGADDVPPSPSASGHSTETTTSQPTEEIVDKTVSDTVESKPSYHGDSLLQAYITQAKSTPRPADVPRYAQPLRRKSRESNDV
jgi:hypothetical protein